MHERKWPTNHVARQCTDVRTEEYSRELVGCLVLPEPRKPIRRKRNILLCKLR